MPAPILPAETVDAWITRLNSEACDLMDLNDADTRATFRTRVADATASLRCDVLTALARHFGQEPKGRNRSAAARALADAWIARKCKTSTPR